jgi:hypothetical protein
VLNIIRIKEHDLGIKMRDFEVQINHSPQDNMYTKAQTLTVLLQSGIHPLVAIKTVGLWGDSEKTFVLSKPYLDVLYKTVKNVEEQAKTVVKEDGSFDTTVLGQIISEKETASAQAKEQEIAKGTPNPGGGGSNQDSEKTEAEKIAASLISSNSSQSNNDVLSHYLGGN